MADLTEDVVELQTRIQFQEDIIQKLDEVVIQQDKRMDKLLRRVMELEDRVEQLAFERNNPADPAAEKPPHY